MKQQNLDLKIDYRYAEENMILGNFVSLLIECENKQKCCQSPSNPQPIRDSAC